MSIDPHRIYRLLNSIQDYEWGSPTAIATLLGKPNPEGKPQAELWMGAHPKAPSRLLEAHLGVADGRQPGAGGASAPPTLAALIASAPEEALGRTVADRFAHELPFLFKVLAAAKGLSIQAHPNLEQARAGFARENAAGIPLSSPERNYQDSNHKPEIICALTPFWGMCGFRPSREISAELERFGLAGAAWATALSEAAAGSSRKAVVPDASGGASGLKAFLAGMLSLAGKEREATLERVLRACRSLRSEAPRYDWVVRLGEQYPGDIGALAPLYLNLVLLAPGEALYLPAGELHAYLDGTGVELMANSDNVLRGGLTTKHVDLPELLSLLTFRAAPLEVVRPKRVNDSLELYPTQTDEFRLARITLDRSNDYRAPLHRSIELLICIEGKGEISYGHPKQWIRFAKGDSFVVPAAVAGYRISGEAVVYRADVPLEGDA